MSARAYLFISATIFALVGVMHLARVILDLPVVVGGKSFPPGLSWGGLVAATVLSIWGFRLAGHRSR